MIIATALRTSRWELVPARISGTSASFAVGNLGVATVRGRIPVTAAWADVDATGLPTAVHAELDLTRIDTGNRAATATRASPTCSTPLTTRLSPSMASRPARPSMPCHRPRGHVCEPGRH